MIEVFPEKDYNELIKSAALFGIALAPDSHGMVMRDGGEVTGVLLWRMENRKAVISRIEAPDKYGPYYDLLFRSALNHLLLSASEIAVEDVNDFYIPLGFKPDGSAMSAPAEEIKFPHHCKSGG